MFSRKIKCVLTSVFVELMCNILHTILTMRYHVLMINYFNDDWYASSNLGYLYYSTLISW